MTDERRSILANPFLWAFFGGCVFLTLLRPWLRFDPAPPPVYGTLPAYEAVDASGTPFGSDDLDGHVYVASFVFTRCQSICPAVLGSVRSLRQRLDAHGLGAIRTVSFTVDPEHDRPEILAARAKELGADPARWIFLTGEPESFRTLLVEGFKVPMGPRTEDGSLLDIAHTGKLVLVDRAGRIRGYHGTDRESLDEMFHRVQHVLAEAPLDGAA